MSLIFDLRLILLDDGFFLNTNVEISRIFLILIFKFYPTCYTSWFIWAVKFKVGLTN